MPDPLDSIRERLEADVYTVAHRNTLDESLAAILSEDYGWKSHPDREIRDAAAWSTLGGLLETAGTATGESEVTALIEYQVDD